MFLNRYFEISLYINNPVSFCINKRQNVLIELENNYVGKCFQGSYINNIIDIVQISNCRINNVSLENNGIIDVKFYAQIFIVNKWDIIIGAHIVKNQSLLISVYKKDELEIDITFIPTTVTANTIMIGQMVPIRTIEAFHKAKTNKIAVAGIILTCDVKSEIYRNTTNEINKTYLPEIQLLLDNIKQELVLREELIKDNKEKLIFFEKLLYSYKSSSNSTKKYKSIKDINDYEGLDIDLSNEANNIFDIMHNYKHMSGYWHRPLKLSRSSPFILFTTNKPSSYKIAPFHVIIIEFAKQILSFLTAVRELVETYNTNELINSHENIWNMMRVKQI